MKSLEAIETMMNQPSEQLIKDVATIEGDIMILGVSGKIGYNLSKLLMSAIKQSKVPKKVYGVARFSGGTEQKFEALGMETIKADFMDEASLHALPKIKNIIFMVGYKFGSVGNEAYTWALNSYLPGRIADIFKDSKIVVFSTGCVYPLVNLRDTAPSEEYAPDALGEYAQSCLGRERVFEYFSAKNKTEMLIFRLNYAIDVRYGVLIELAKSIKQKQAIDLSMGHVNVIWQPDVSEMAIRSLLHTRVPANIVNITGPETLSVKWLSEMIASEMGMEVSFVGESEESALLSNASKSHEMFGYPRTSIREMIRIVSQWVVLGGDLDDKPTHFQEREGKY